ncbi:hypothetical protein BDV28DRAFT_145079 [Aspergillus coremiiformis]|uniref:Oligopeptide transporter n=1 Tax=Aspergillus coremiiformis TaxID=138285 RepID=A0A5N6ZGQ7_9EURO|nr:hypothetical protein BDV28DRAFT_145079 [Aspergillus coremiiformis]
MSSLMPDVYGSADITAGPSLQSRLVMVPQARNVSHDTDACASLSLPKTEQDGDLSSEVNDHAALHANRSIPTPLDEDDGRVATEEEVRHLLHVVDKIPVRLWVACLAGILERFVWYGVTAPLQNYLQNPPGGEVPGALGLHQATASNIVNALTCRVLLLFPIHWLCYNQTFNNLISQAGQMVTYGIPNDMMKIAGAISGIIVAPIIQKGLYPCLTKRGVSFGPIARMTVGFILLTLSMAYTTVVQKLIYQTGPCYDTPLACAAANDHTIPNQISVFLQVPIYFGGALAEVFCLTTGTEYAYNQAPKSMKTLVQAIWLAMAGIGTFLALAFTPLTKDPHLVTMYAILTGLLGGATILLWVLFGHLDKLKTKDDVE